MKNPWVFILVAVFLVVVSTLAAMNNACRAANMSGALRRLLCGTT
jgi:hypothetical protein